MRFFLSILLILSISVLGIASAVSQDEKAALVKELEDLSTELRLQREKQEAERLLTKNRKEILLEEIEALKNRETILSERRKKIEEETVTLTESLKKHETDAEGLNKKETEFQNLIDSATDALINHINAGLPVDTDERIDAVKALLGSNESNVERLKLLWQFYIQEYRRGGRDRNKGANALCRLSG
jgi:chromosome segregation ATPase